MSYTSCKGPTSSNGDEGATEIIFEGVHHEEAYAL